MATHEIKCDPIHFANVEKGVKSFEIRKDDRGYQEGDVLHIREFDRTLQAYSGRFVARVVTYILRDDQYLQPGYVCMAIV